VGKERSKRPNYSLSVDLLCAFQPLEEVPVQTRPDSRGLPFPQAPPASHPSPAVHFLRQVSPVDARQGGAVGHRYASKSAGEVLSKRFGSTPSTSDRITSQRC